MIVKEGECMSSSSNKQSLQTYFKFHPITSTLLLLNLLMLIAVMATGGFTVPNLFRFGALLPAAVTEGNEVFRLVAAMFLHGSFFHFLSNSFVLFYLGSALERLIGPARYTLVYLISGIGSGIAVVLFASSNSITVGASGAIFGIIGSLLILTFQKPNWFTPQSIRSIRTLMVYNVIFTFLIPIVSIPGHIGGLVIGVIVIFPLIPVTPYFVRYFINVTPPPKKDDDSDYFS